ncbi:MAG: ankyrin repeat domain-containing protein [Planctomycetaceae bacterium]|nr:ankyrin repeat domain-containing protein [Planctomycetaceae bacterium]
MRLAIGLFGTVLAVGGAIIATGVGPHPAPVGSTTPAFKSEPPLDAAPPQVGPQQVGHPLFCSPHFSPIVSTNDLIFVVNTPCDTVDVIARGNNEIVRRIPVGVDPVSLALRPDGKELWVSNHISDSVSIIDTVFGSRTYLHIVATVQQFDRTSKATTFDEPVGIAFAGNSKAYVALSSENQIAIVDVEQRKITGRLRIPAQDPRAIVVRGDRLYVLPFESNNQTQLSGGSADDIDGDLYTFDAWQHSIIHNNVLSLGHVVDIVKHPDVPDHDLFVFDTRTDQLTATIDSLGTLLYGMTVDSAGDVYVAQTDARNHINGRAGTKKHGMAELENRAFLNQITRVRFENGRAATPEFLELEPLPPQHPQPNEALATPYAVQISDDDRLLVATAAGSDKLFTLDAATGQVLGRVSVGAVPRGVSLQHTADGSLESACVYNAVANTVSMIDLQDPAHPRVTGFVPLEDPTERQVKLGRTWFNSAAASTTGTYSCASCHPDGHTDQLLWVLKTPIVSGGDQIMPRSTMPLRGLRDTAPYHWDGVPGDPYGGNNSASVWESVPANSDVDVPESSTRHLIDGGLASTMLQHGSEVINDEGKAGAFSAAERDDMAKFLLAVPYPPAQRRAYTNQLSQRATRGFELFHIDGHHDEKPKPNVCGDCHRLPHLVSTNTPGTGMDAPTWRGAYDRFLILPQGRLNIIEFDFYRRVAEQGIPEKQLWQFSWQGQQRFDPIWDMVLEGSTGYSGTFARQVTLSADTHNQPLTASLLDAMEQSAAEGAIVLEADGVQLSDERVTPVTLQYAGGLYVPADSTKARLTRDELLALAADGRLICTFTARHGGRDDTIAYPQPILWTQGPLEQQSGHQKFPIVYPGQSTMKISGRHVDPGAYVIVDGRRTDGFVTVNSTDRLTIELPTLPKEGLHLLQVQNPAGQFSNDFLFNVVDSAQAKQQLAEQRERNDRDIRDALAEAITAGDVAEVRRHLNRRQQQGRVNEQRPRSGSTPLNTAVLYGQHEIVEVLLRRGADVNGANRDGTTPLHIAAFFCQEKLLKRLLEKGASTTQTNRRGETALDTVSGQWDQGMADLYQGIADAVNIEIDLQHLQESRPRMAELLNAAE